MKPQHKLDKETSEVRDRFRSIYEEGELKRKIHKISEKRYQIVKENAMLLAQGRRFEYDSNCNFLKGITYTLEQLK